MSAVFRFSLLDLARRRLLTGLVLVQALLIWALALTRHWSGAPAIAESFALFLALVIGASALRPELESGAADLLLSRPLAPTSFSAGKVLAAAAALAGATGAAGLLCLPLVALGTRPAQLAGALTLAWANTSVVAWAVMLFSTRFSGPVAALLGFILFEGLGAVTALRALVPGSVSIGAYSLLPHRLAVAWLGPADLAGWAVYLAAAGLALHLRLVRLRPD